MDCECIQMGCWHWGEAIFVDDDAEENIATGRVCIKTKIKTQILDSCLVSIKGVNYHVRVHEFANWVPKFDLSDISQHYHVSEASDNDQNLHSTNELEDKEGEVNAYWAPNIESKEDKSMTNSLKRKDDEGPSLDGGSEHEEPLEVDNLCKTRTFALRDKLHSFFAPEGKPPRRGLNPRPLSHVMSGLSKVGQDYYGAFPLQGKLLNVREASPRQLNNNDAIRNIKKILGLQHNRVYENGEELRYGRLMIMADQATNKKTKKVRLFYSIANYEAWEKRLGDKATEYEIEYYKVGDAIELAFSKKKIKERKEWLLAFKVKDVHHIINIHSVLKKEEFSNFKCRYMGGLWLWIEFSDDESRLKF
uniref:DNA topoisomerase (ATP-hydrolyzing) n=1 Tax=Tanacetum cinerariifolium TaxID=118510 RepID=A0A6L2NEN8_TANCI|nr:DNA topoisomerase 2 [Tanacetum cinerariifolium]